jgi:hypothetical protein
MGKLTGVGCHVRLVQVRSGSFAGSRDIDEISKPDRAADAWETASTTWRLGTSHQRRRLDDDFAGSTKSPEPVRDLLCSCG